MTSSPDDGFAAAADALYALPAAGFVAERTARAKAARAGGDRDLAARITALTKPSAAAALVNRLVRERGEDLDRVLDLGRALRRAQQDGDRERLRSLGTDRRDLLEQVTRAAADLAGHEGRVPGAAVLEEVQQTLQAALADDAAAAAVRTGRLLRTLQADGLDPADLAGAVGGPGGAPVARGGRTRSGGGAEQEPEDDVAARKEAEARADDAERSAREAQQQAEAARQRADGAAEALERRRLAERDLQSRIDDLLEQQQAARDAAAEAETVATTAAEEAERATEAATTARAHADEAAAEAEAEVQRLG